MLDLLEEMPHKEQMYHEKQQANIMMRTRGTDYWLSEKNLYNGKHQNISKDNEKNHKVTRVAIKITQENFPTYENLESKEPP